MANKKSRLIKSVLVAAALVAVLLVGGCSQLGSGKGRGSSIPEVYTGTAGVDAAFAPDGVPGVMTERSSSEAVLFITNNGAVDADISTAIVTVSDNSEAVVFDDKKVKVILGSELLGMLKAGDLKDGKLLPGKETGVVGSLVSLLVRVKARAIAGKDPVDTGLQAKVCYGYKTKLTANVCVDAAPYSFQKQRKPCDAKLPLSFQSQGAPVAVKRIETLAPEKESDFVKPKFKIFLANVGNGLAIDKDSLNLFCIDDTKTRNVEDKVGVVQVDSIVLNNKGLVCNKKLVTLTGNLANNFVLCSYPYNDFADGSGVFATPLKVEVSYGYRSTSNPVPVRVEKGFASTQQQLDPALKGGTLA